MAEPLARHPAELDYFQNDFAAPSPTKSCNWATPSRIGVNLTIDPAGMPWLVVMRSSHSGRSTGWLLCRWRAGALRHPFHRHDAHHRPALEQPRIQVGHDGRVVDSYTNIHTLKTFSPRATRRLRGASIRITPTISAVDEGVHIDVVDPVRAQCRLVISIALIALPGWNNGSSAPGRGDRHPVRAPDHDMSGWILDDHRTDARRCSRACSPMSASTMP